jgi:hypothetical protein
VGERLREKKRVVYQFGIRQTDVVGVQLFSWWDGQIGGKTTPSRDRPFAGFICRHVDVIRFSPQKKRMWQHHPSRSLRGRGPLQSILDILCVTQGEYLGDPGARQCIAELKEGKGRSVNFGIWHLGRFRCRLNCEQSLVHYR